MRHSGLAPLPLLLLAIPVAVAAQNHIESPAAYVESIETPTPVGGVATETDAGAEQAEATGSATFGTGGRRTGRVEEIVVQARKRDEFLEETPVSVTALSESTLREAGITRLDQIQQLVPNLQS